MADPLDDPDTVAALHLIAERDRARPGRTCPRCGHRYVNTNSTSGWCYRCEQEHQDTVREGKRRWARRNRARTDVTTATDTEDTVDNLDTVDTVDTPRRGSPTQPGTAGAIELLTVADVVTVLGVGRQTVYRLADGGDLQQIRVRGQRRIVASSVDAFIARQLDGGEQ